MQGCEAHKELMRKYSKAKQTSSGNYKNNYSTEKPKAKTYFVFNV
jgi:hypothetical protein